MDKIRAFWTGVYEQTDYYEWASEKAYRDMCRTIEFPDGLTDTDKMTLRKKGTYAMRQAIEAGCSSFDTFHKEVCDRLRVIYDLNLTYGHAQKWLNMTLKYLWLIDRLDLIKDETLSAFIKTHCENFHVPLDSYILQYAAADKRNKTVPRNGLTHPLPNEWENKWSKIGDYDRYKAYQVQLTARIESGSPLEWELEHWPKALDFYANRVERCANCRSNLSYLKERKTCPICNHEN